MATASLENCIQMTFLDKYPPSKQFFGPPHPQEKQQAFCSFGFVSVCIPTVCFVENRCSKNSIWHIDCHGQWVQPRKVVFRDGHHKACTPVGFKPLLRATRGSWMGYILIVGLFNPAYDGIRHTFF